MKLRYVSYGTVCFPQYRSEDGKWNYFTKENVSNAGLLTKLVEELAELGYMHVRKWSNAPYVNNEGLVFFANELLCSAFLGAATVFYVGRQKEFNLSDDE